MTAVMHWWLCWQWRRKPFGLSRTGQTGHLSFVEQGPAQMFLCIKAVDWHICEFLLAKTAGETPNLFLQTAVLVHLRGPGLGISLMERENASWEIEYWAERLTKIALKRRNQCSWKLIARPPWYQLGSANVEGIIHLGEGSSWQRPERDEMTVLYELNVSHRAGKGFCPGSTQLIFTSALGSHCDLQLLAKEKGKGAESKEER